MASLLLSFAGNALGAAFGPAGAMVGRAAGALAGGAIDRALFGGSARREVQGPRLNDLDVMGSTEGAAVPRVYGRARLSGHVIWATKLQEVVSTRTETTGGGKGGSGGGGSQTTTTTTTYSYFANFAVGLCEGEVARVGRIWADGKPLDIKGLNVRIYRGGGSQLPDPLIEAKEGSGKAPAYRGLCYLVFERLPLENFGNRLPQISAEVMRPVGKLERMIRAITLIPGSTEFGYDTVPVVRALGQGVYAPENRHVTSARTDWKASLDELEAVCPNLERIALVVAWFGNDLRAGVCLVRPAVDNASKVTEGATWSVAGMTRAAAPVVSTHQGRPAFGGTPSDASLIRAIQNLNARGLKVTFYPFVMMDIPAGNTRNSPYGGASQPPYPWRGQITCHPAPGQPETVDGTSAAASQIESLFGDAEPDDFSVSGGVVNYSGPAEWSLRRMILHYAHLCEAAGGVDTFLIGSEMEALTRVRSSSSVYPAVSQFRSLAEDVRAVVGSGTKISYAANWSEYGAHVVDEEAQDVRFPLDPLWAHDDIDFVGIDYYAPLADWRDGGTHLDAALTDSIHDREYLRGNLRGGEFYDFYYADEEARRAQDRTAIADSLGKPWTFRAKDYWNWWASPHFERVDGVELGSPTAWVPQGKQIRFTEVGCPAVDKGANEPNVFPDAKSSVGGYPNFSNRRRDDLMQRRFHEAVISNFDPEHGATAGDNPASSVYSGRMVHEGAIFPWTWDARPYPAFPLATDAWADGPNWETGHWLNGRLGAAPLDDLVAAICEDHGFSDFDSTRLRGAIDGYVVDRPMSARASIEPLALAFSFDAVEEGSELLFRMRGGKPVAEIAGEDLVVEGERAECRLVRAQETELPIEVSLGYTEVSGDYRRANARSRRLVGDSRREARADLAVVANDAIAERAADTWLQDLWAGRERAEFSLPPSRIALTPGDVIALEVRGRERLVEIGETADAGAIAVKARGIDPEIFTAATRPPRPATVEVPAADGPPLVHVLDLPALTEGEPALQHFAVHASPWPGAMSLWRSSGESFERVALATAPALVGETLDDLAPGPAHRWDRANAFRVRLASGALASASEAAVLNGANAAAVRTPSGDWHLIQFANAELVDEQTYLLSGLLRGQLGSEWTLSGPIPAGSAFVRIDAALVPVARGADMLGRTLSWHVGRASDDIGSETMTALESTVNAVALLPWAPAHLRAVRTGAGIHISWVRRTRFGGDSWDALDVPLNEEVEAYRVAILDGDEAVRTTQTSTPELLYANADETADFGAPQSSLHVRVAQLSAVAGAGHPREAILQL